MDRSKRYLGGQIDRTRCDWISQVKKRKEPRMGLRWASGGAVAPRVESAVRPWAQCPLL